MFLLKPEGLNVNFVLLLVIEALGNGAVYFLQFALDCSVLPSVIHATQMYGNG